jgi:putative SOS response-associated peptidase YedK
MCNLYTYRVMPEEMAGLIAHFKLIGRQFAEVMRMKNDPDVDVYPNRRAPVIVMQDGQPVARTDMLWGFPPYGGKGPYATNYRTLNNHMWRDWLDQEHRCIVPATAFAEYDDRTNRPEALRWFARTDGVPAFFFAGIWRPWTGDRGSKKAPNIGDHHLFSIMTTEPNGLVKPIHGKAMPVMLMTPEDVERWLAGKNVADALELQKAAPDDVIRIVDIEKAA